MPVVKGNDMPPLYKPYMRQRGKKRRLMGVFVKGCVERGDGSSFRATAHSHTSKNDPYRGWVCIRAERRLNEEQLLIHELAHILTRQGHTSKFFDKFVELGGNLQEDNAYKWRLRREMQQMIRDDVRRQLAN